MPTGSGKTVCMGDIIQTMGVPSIVMAHRQELVAQIALMLNREHVPHSIIAPNPVIRQIQRLELMTHGRSVYEPRSSTRVAGVNTLARKAKTPERWMLETQLTIVDEGHHVQDENVWGRAIKMFPNARGLFLTAHALRGDNKGLGRHVGGLADSLVTGISARRLIDMGMLCNYRLIAPAGDVDLSGVHVGASGEFNQDEVRKAVHESPTIVGDVVKTYLKFAPGKLGITFAVDIESAAEIAEAYRQNGVPAAIITGETPLETRGALMQQFRERRLLQLVSVDVLGEGVDVPAVEVVSMARPTASFQLYAQQSGRALRLLISADDTAVWNDLDDHERKRRIARSDKPVAILIDHVQNWLRHGLPDTPREYSLEPVERKKKGAGEIKLKACVSCLSPYEAYRLACPHCGYRPEVSVRGAPAQVEGDLVDMDLDILRQLEKEKKHLDGPPVLPYNAPQAHGAVRHTHYARQVAQQQLREAMSLWMGWQQHLGHEIREAQRKFYAVFNVDVLTAQTLSTTEAEALRARVQATLDRANIVNAERHVPA